MQEILLSKKQTETLQDFFSWEYTEILYWGWARWWKSFLIWVLLAIWVAAMPWSKWLLSRTVLSELQATTLSTFFQVLKMFWFGEKSYRDKIRERKRLEFVNGSEVYVIQVNYEPSDPEFDRLGSYSYTWAFLDEWQQMVSKVRNVLDGRFSETSGDFKFYVPKPKKWKPNFNNLAYNLKIKVVWEAEFDEKDFNTPKEEIKEVVKSGKYKCAIVDYVDFKIPYKVINVEDLWNKYEVQVVWQFSPTTLISCNPWKNFTYTDFYKPYIKGLAEWDEFKYLTTKLPWWQVFKKKFVRALVTDNPFVEKRYIYRLQAGTDEVTKQRLLYWNFEYDDDPTLLFSKDIIDNSFWEPLNTDDTYFLTVDAARKGKDNTVIMLWKWLDMIETFEIKAATLTEQKKIIQDYINKYKINLSNVIIDEVWVWGWLVDMIWCKGFIANASPLQPYSIKYRKDKKRNYANLRTQAFFYLEQYMRDGKIRIKANPTLRETITEELLFIKQKDIDSDTKITLESKKDMKEMLGRSPDYADALSFRMRWIIKNHHEWNVDNADKEEQKDSIIDILEEHERELEEQRKLEMINKDLDLDVY